jgi:hypothetical protein
MGNEKKTLSTYVEHELAEKVEREAKNMRVSTSAVLRWAIMDRYRIAELAEDEQRTEPVRS